jgi:hypothetical protein
MNSIDNILKYDNNFDNVYTVDNIKNTQIFVNIDESKHLDTRLMDKSFLLNYTICEGKHIGCYIIFNIYASNQNKCTTISKDIPSRWKDNITIYFHYVS